MEALIKRLRQALAAEFSGAKLILAQAKPVKKITGEIVWDGFNGVAHIDRQRRLRTVIDSALDVDERLAVSLILTLTPDENVVMSGSSKD
jgi:hypothetical protein